MIEYKEIIIGRKKVEKVGIIDLGSNSARLVLAEITDDGYFRVFDQLKDTVRLSHDMERDGFLKPVRVAQTIKTLKSFKRLCDAYGVEKIISVATAAVRRAKNQKSFLEEVYVTCGIKLRVLTHEEEGLLVYTGVINSMDIPKGLIIDIGGGSTNLIYYNRRNIIEHETLPFGAVTLTDLFANDNMSSEEQTHAIEEFFTEQLSKLSWLKDIDPETKLIGVGGSFRNLARISKRVRKYPLDAIHYYTLPITDLNNVYDMVRVLDLDKKKKIKGLTTSRADIFQSALAVMKSFTDNTNFGEITISGSGLREGMLFNLAQPITLEKPLSDPLAYSLRAAIKLYNQDERHVIQVEAICIQLFKQLRVLHKFPRQYLRVLRIAAAMHDTGMQVNYYDHAIHSAYMILNSNIYGANHRAIVLASFVCLVHRHEDINFSEWSKYRDLLTEEDVDVVKKLGSILKIAESLDRTGKSVIKSLTCDVLGDSVIMKTETEGDSELEIKEAMLAAPDFKKAFKKNLEIL